VSARRSLLLLLYFAFESFEKMDIEVEDNVWIAAGDGSLERTFAFIGAGPVDVKDENGYTPLMAASAYGKVDLVRELLKRGANPNLKDTDGNTAVHHCDYPECLRVLIDGGGKISIRNNDGQTPLDAKQEELAEAEEDFSDEEELDEGEIPTSHRLKQLVSALVEASVEEEKRKRTKG